MTARPHPSPAEQITGLTEAADVLVGCADLDVCVHAGGDGDVLGHLRPPLARLVALNLRSSAEAIRRRGCVMGLPVSYDLELAGLVLGRDLGHNRD